MAIHPVIMCGGAGTRLWPVSNRACPKQFRSLVSEKSVFQETVLRFVNTAVPDFSARPIIISNADYADLIDTQLAEIGVAAEAILLEPEGRNTAAVAAVAARYIAAVDPGGLALLVPSDHYISAPEIFIAAVAAAAPIARANHITTFGIQPDRPNTGFGYIQAGASLGAKIARIAAFREKPDLATARAYLAGGDYSWNAGIFLFPAELMLNELSAHAADVLTHAGAALSGARQQGVRLYLALDAFAMAPSISLDYAVMEKTSRAAVYAPLNCGWSDIGTWAMIGAVSQRLNDVAPVEIGAANCLVHADAGRLVALVGVSDLVVVVDGDTVLVAHKDAAQNVGQIVKTLKDRGQPEFL
jgi:mannose-1-phosphate guanylyltransferase / mannose-6-phosphate isomerase